MAKILVVDDEEDMRATLALLLEAEGYSVVTAVNGHGALEQLKKDAPDMIVSDIRMPDMDGVELLQHVKDTNPVIPVVMVTGYGSAELAVETMKLGAFDYLQKPFDNDRFYEVVKAALSQATLQRSAAKGGVVEQRLSQKLQRQPVAAASSPAKPAAASSPASVIPISSDEDPERPAWLWPVVGAVVLLLAGAGFWVRSRVNWGMRTLPVETQNISGLQATATGLWMADWMAQSVVRLDLEQSLWVPTNLKKVQSFTLTGRNPTGITVGGPDTLYTCDTMAGKIFAHRLEAGLQVKTEVASPGPSPSGVFWDGKYLWSLDAQNRKIYRHNNDPQLTVINIFDSPGKHPVGLGWDGETIWSADAEDKLLYRHQTGETFKVIETYRLPSGTPERFSAFTRDRDRIWIAAEGSNSILVIQPSTLLPVR